MTEDISKETNKDTTDSLDINSPIEWNDAIETLIKEQGEKSLSYNWLHTRCEKKYSYLNNYIAIPCIIMSTISGSASIASNQFGDNMYIPLGIGAFSILVGILSTVNSYFSWAKRSENHRISALNYSKLYLFISIELSLPREKRMNPRDFIKVIREQIERLGEISPPIADDIIKQFRCEFDNKYPNVSKPEITNGLVEIKVYKEPPPTVKDNVAQTVEPKDNLSMHPEYLNFLESIPASEGEDNDSLSVGTVQTVVPLSRKMTKKLPVWK